MREGHFGLYHLRQVIEKISETPTDWPFIFFLPILAGIVICSREEIRPRIRPLVRPIVILGSALTLLATFRIAVSYLSTNFIIDGYATLYASTSWLFCLHQPVYSGARAVAPYSLPYGPCGYMLVGCFQKLLGPSLFSSKLPAFLATFGSQIFLYLALRSRVTWLAALGWTALASALLLPFDPIQFWPRPDPFLVLSISGGLWASTRREIWGVILLGFFIGFAINLKVYAFAFFFVPIAGAWRQNNSPVRWTLACLVAIITALLPFAWPNISLVDYLRVLKMDSATRFMDNLAVEYMQWWAVLFMAGFAPLLIQKQKAADTWALLQKNAGLSGALLLSFLLVSFPASKEGAGPHHLMPFIPVVVYFAACLSSDPSLKSIAWRTLSWMGLSLVLSVVLFAELNALFLGLWQPITFASREKLAQQRIDDIRSLFHDKMPCILLNAAGSIATQNDDSYRAILVFNGMPLGIDPSVSMDYKSLGHQETDLAAFVAALQSKYHQPIVWICPRDVIPFSATSYFGSGQQVFSDKFVSDFHRQFGLSGHTPCFDLYEQKVP